MLLDHAALAFSLFRQLALRRFACCPPITLDPPVDIKDYLSAAIQAAADEDNLSSQALATEVDSAYAVLAHHAPMLQAYFSIYIDASRGQLTGLPELLRGYHPLLEELPMFLWRLATQVSFKDEVECFDAIANKLAYYYAALPDESSASQIETPREERRLGPVGTDTVEQVFMPAVKQLLWSSRDYEELGIVSNLASLEQLYKIFERC